VQVIYEDNHIIAVNKAGGEVVQSDKTGDETILDIVKLYLKEKYDKPGNVFLGLPHRLDRPTTGVLVLAKTGKVLPRLNKLFQTRDEVKKTYWAVVAKRPEIHTETLTHYLVYNPEKNRSYAYTEKRPGSKLASLTYRHVASIDNYHLLEIELHTGRHHQIRVQLRQLKLYIKGDIKYGFPRPNADKSIHLHARRIDLMHPVKNEMMTIIADPPDDVVWNEFMKLFRGNKFSPVNPV
jgi:23S rRNA pseudouridine1911/1915/1917 synthase